MNSKLDNLTLSWSAFESYEACPFKFYRKYALRETEPTNIFALYGSAIHGLLKHIYLVQKFNPNYAYSIWESMLQSEYELPFKQEQYEDIGQEDVDKIAPLGFRHIKNFFELGKGEGLLMPTDVLEMTVRGNYKRHKLVVKIDVKLELPDYGRTLLDWKTGSEKDSSLYQLALYAALYQKKTGERIDTVAPVYLKTKNVEYQRITPEFKKKVGEYINECYTRVVEDRVFAPKKNEYCETCYLKKSKVCPL